MNLPPRGANAAAAADDDDGDDSVDVVDRELGNGVLQNQGCCGGGALSPKGYCARTGTRLRSRSRRCTLPTPSEPPYKALEKAPSRSVWALSCSPQSGPASLRKRKR